MTKTIAILATIDTKGEECGYLRDEIIRIGGKVIMLDIGVIKDANIHVDINSNETAEQGGTSLDELRINPSRLIASEVMVRGATKILLEKITEGEVDGVISLGGTQGTNNCTKVMQALPYGFPKLMVSTLASGDTSGYVGIKDITMMFSVSDILGLNPLFRCILSNAAGAIVGMADAAITTRFNSNRPLVGITNLGCLTQGTMLAIEELSKRGYETIVFHAVSAGGRAMEQLMHENIVTAVLDYAQGDIVDALFGGIRAGDENRLTVAVDLGLPQVVVPGGIDHIGIVLEEANVVTEKYKDRLYSFHNPMILVPRTNAEEITKVIYEIGNRLTNDNSNTVFVLPKKGVSSYSAEEGELYDEESDNALFSAVHGAIPKNIPVIEVDSYIESEEFVKIIVDELVRLIEKNKKKFLRA